MPRGFDRTAFQRIAYRLKVNRMGVVPPNLLSDESALKLDLKLAEMAGRPWNPVIFGNCGQGNEVGQFVERAPFGREHGA
jgi:hypothetical protein